MWQFRPQTAQKLKKLIEKLGYQGTFGLEHQPSIDHEESV
jgi:hypothetical protein